MTRKTYGSAATVAELLAAGMPNRTALRIWEIDEMSSRCSGIRRIRTEKDLRRVRMWQKFHNLRAILIHGKAIVGFDPLPTPAAFCRQHGRRIR